MVCMTSGRIILCAGLLCGVLPGSAAAQGPRPSPQQGAMMPMLSIDQIVRMSPAELDQLYRQSASGPIPTGKVRGIAIPYPGTRMAPGASKVAHLIWQGKVFDPCASMITNRFFGLKLIKGQVYPGESWMDGGPATIIDYAETSRLYAPNRDEIREVAPCLYLGLMYRRTCPQPTLKTYFLLDAHP